MPISITTADLDAAVVGQFCFVTALLPLVKQKVGSSYRTSGVL